jgi:hypothetical protein
MGVVVSPGKVPRSEASELRVHRPTSRLGRSRRGRPALGPLRRGRLTQISGFGLLVCTIGVCFFLFLLGYSINLLSLLAMVLAIGLVVDDAIVV